MNLLNSRYAEQLSEIMHRVKQNAEHPYVQQYVDLPPVSQLRLQLLYLFLHDQDIPEELIIKYCVSVTLIQMGLDSHQEVPLSADNNLKNVRSRQLLVLAGDYFSSRYYFLLAEVEDTDTIKALAASIQAINEAKMNLYYRMQKKKMDGQNYLSYVNVIDASLYLSFVSRYPSSSGHAWTSLIENLVLAERLLEEYRTYKWENKVQGYLSLVWDHRETHRSVQHLINKVDGLLHSSMELSAHLKKQDTREEILFLIAAYAKEMDLTPSKKAEEL